MRKLPQEAKHCLKCQKLGTSHLAAQCLQKEDMCSTCGSKDHPTSACMADNLEQRKCISCNKHGHASWDRNCLAFKIQNERLQQKNPETNMQFFPSSRDPQSWESILTTPKNDQTHVPPPPLPRFRLSTTDATLRSSNINRGNRGNS